MLCVECDIVRLENVANREEYKIEGFEIWLQRGTERIKRTNIVGNEIEKKSGTYLPRTCAPVKSVFF